ncbi:alpha/beta hydrolase [Sphingomonas sp. PAMC 26621]|uniref:alpha/beta hydrolase n=1 Tax=Sphingomonas sp. PAMC 26621 TaxID=1112213 RepID=UPI000288B685|nr:alpha/beta hydrolase [Sphingomonas sp. PAMC 26621]
MTGPTLVFLHALGASAKEWDRVVEHLPHRACVALDLPGFGDAADAGYADVAAMADWLAAEIRSRHLTACVLVGHSMGGKIVTLVAARAASGEIGLSGVLGVVLVAASPPAPEPMDEDRRAEMIGWFADRSPTRDDAVTFVDANTATPLAGEARDQAIADVQRSSREAWLGWLERGSREDWRAIAGQVPIPALILAGAEDGDLGAEAQRRLNLPHYATAELRVVEGAAHLIPYEQPQVLAGLIDGHAAMVEPAALPARFARLLDSDRVSHRTRAAMVDRLHPPSSDLSSWTDDHVATMAALVGQILPDCGADRALADRILAGIAEGPGDGWRFAALPADRAAWTRGLATLAAFEGGFATAPGTAQAALLECIDAGETGIAEDDSKLTAEQMRLWFEDVRAETARVWMSLPATMAAIGYDGFANGGDGPRKQGYTRTAADDLETWQRPVEQSS